MSGDSNGMALLAEKLAGTGLSMEDDIPEIKVGEGSPTVPVAGVAFAMTTD